MHATTAPPVTTRIPRGKHYVCHARRAVTKTNRGNGGAKHARRAGLRTINPARTPANSAQQVGRRPTLEACNAQSVYPASTWQMIPAEHVRTATTQTTLKFRAAPSVALVTHLVWVRLHVKAVTLESSGGRTEPAWPALLIHSRTSREAQHARPVNLASTTFKQARRHAPSAVLGSIATAMLLAGQVVRHVRKGVTGEVRLRF